MWDIGRPPRVSPAPGGGVWNLDPEFLLGVDRSSATILESARNVVSCFVTLPATTINADFDVSALIPGLFPCGNVQHQSLTPFDHATTQKLTRRAVLSFSSFRI